MIKLDKVNKYFYRGKSNQIHVIDNTSMVLPDNGIVCLLGPSGCGKTTLLNAIGGLDKVDGGAIYIDGDRITRRTAGKIDTIRNAKIGYIFQNFYLLDDRTVYDNVAIALNMVGVTDRKTVRERVNYCLESVGIYQYRNKLASALSGGQRQRVAIARAIVKNPKIIIADEPTGNLDSSNTLEIMNIIKGISKDRLVILVTHERKIAEFYSDYVAEMKDGKIINSYVNDDVGALDYQLDNKIFLKDMPVQKKMASENIEVDYFSDEDRDSEIKLVVKGGNLYIDTGGRFNVIDESADIELVDDHYKAIDESIFEKNRFKYDEHLPKNFKAKYTSVYRLTNIIGKGWKSIKGFGRIKKILMIGFVFAAMFSFLAVANVLGIYDVQPEDYLTTNDHYVTISNPGRSDELLRRAEVLEGADYVIPGDTKKMVILPLDDYLQSSYATADLNVSICENSVLKPENIILGEMPDDAQEVVLDKFVVDAFLKEGNGKSVGLTTAEQMIGRTLRVNNMNSIKEFTIVGISNVRSPSMFVDPSRVIDFLMYAANQNEYEFGEDDSDPVVSGQVKDIKNSESKLKIKKGRKPEAAFEVILENDESWEYKIGDKIKTKMGGHKLKVVGFYTSNVYGETTMYVNSATMYKHYIRQQKVFSVYGSKLKPLKKSLNDEGISFTVNKTRDKNNYIKKMKNVLKSSLIVAGIILLISLIEMFLMLRSSFLARIKEVGTMRAIGLKKRDIYRMFTGEIVVITFITAVPGIALMYYLLTNIVKITDYLASMYMVTPYVAGITFALILVFNLLVGLIPVSRTMRKTPAAILARTDI